VMSAAIAMEAARFRMHHKKTPELGGGGWNNVRATEVAQRELIRT
jgi:hypothetical protein